MSPVRTNSLIIHPPTADDVVAEARKWLETRWVHQGRNEFGIDCAGLLIKVHQGLNLPVQDEQGYKRDPNFTRFLDHIKKQTDPVAEPVPGAIAIFREMNFPCHTGIFCIDEHGELAIIHSYIVAKRVVEERFTEEWSSRLVATRLIRGVSY